MKNQSLTLISRRAWSLGWLDRLRHSRSLWPLGLSLCLITLALVGTLSWQYAEGRSPLLSPAGAALAQAEGEIDLSALPATAAGGGGVSEASKVSVPGDPSVLAGLVPAPQSVAAR
ncbi:hypothetical protein PSQ39_10065 [Curvibacter sp. HBC28]|uniref:Uncharacterized protein n=1 Tax=Curvibacter microcysteis TaxID=3026419 RepID=A0ABT5MEG2_9BURK|nr:hypothetical protein [Curvibacter sp. HBC28]MDD0814974.1 hypothetical protein [Curvibacter sp. HBC28]